MNKRVTIPEQEYSDHTAKAAQLAGPESTKYAAGRSAAGGILESERMNDEGSTGCQ